MAGGPSWLFFESVVENQHFALPGASPAGRTLLAVATPDHTRAALLPVPNDMKRTGTAAVWDLATRKKLADFEIPGTPTYGGAPDAVLTPKGTRLVLASHIHENSRAAVESRIHVWDVAGKNAAAFTFPGFDGHAALAAADERELVYAAPMRIWHWSPVIINVLDIGTGASLRTLEPLLEPRPAANRPMVFNRDRTRFAMAVSAEPTKSPSIRLHEWPSGKLLKTFTGHTSDITALAFAPDGKTLASGSQDSSILFWRVLE